MRMMQWVRCFVVFAAAVFGVAACGGSGGGGASRDASLADLVLSAGSLTPEFASSTLAYTVGPSLLAGIVTITPTVSAPSATVMVDGVPTASGSPSAPIPLALGITAVSVQVTAPDGTTRRTYTVVFDRSLTGQMAYVKASNTEAGDAFAGGQFLYPGPSLALDGETLVVGAPLEDSGATGVNGDQMDNSVSASGAVYVYVWDGATWVQEAYLKASVHDPEDYFGFSVAISGDTLVVGAPIEDSSSPGVNGDAWDNAAPSSGAAYVFVRDGATWSQQAYLKASNPGASDQFGLTVALSGDTLIVGANLEASDATGVNGDGANDTAPGSGAAYVFVRDGTTWAQQAYLKASNAGASDNFGYSVAISGNTIVVGAPFEASNATGVNGNEADDSASTSGAAYVFARSGTTWTQQAYLKASNTDVGDLFGGVVVIDGDTLVVGARQEDSSATGVGGNQASDSALQSGAAYVFVRSGAIWTQQAYLKASNTADNDFFGSNLCVAGDTVLVGAEGEDSSATGVDGDQSDDSVLESGAAYVFVRVGASWVQAAYLKASNPGLRDRFGSQVACGGEILVVGAPLEASSATGIDGDQADDSAPGSGAAYAFR